MYYPYKLSTSLSLLSLSLLFSTLHFDRDLRGKMVVDEIKVFHQEEEVPLSQSRVSELEVLLRVAKEGIDFVSFLSKAKRKRRTPIIHKQLTFDLCDIVIIGECGIHPFFLIRTSKFHLRLGKR